MVMVMVKVMMNTVVVRNRNISKNHTVSRRIKKMNNEKVCLPTDPACEEEKNKNKFKIGIALLLLRLLLYHLFFVL